MRTIISSLFFIFLLPLSAAAAELSISGPFDTAHAGDRFVLSVSLDPEGASVNAIEGTVALSPNLKVLEARLNDSFVPLWVVRPEAGSSSVSFAGIIPNGYLGSLSNEWKGYRAGALFTLVVEAKGAGPSALSFGTTTTAYANDGAGTRLPLKALGASFTVLPEGSSRSAPAISLDTALPEPFMPLVTDGQPFGVSGNVLVFSAEDKQSGILYYEIAHDTQSHAAQNLDSLSWQRGESPYTLSPEEEREYVFVRAVDSYGNARVAVVPPVESPLSAARSSSILVVALLLSAIFLAYIAYRRRAPHGP